MKCYLQLYFDTTNYILEVVKKFRIFVVEWSLVLNIFLLLHFNFLQPIISSH